MARREKIAQEINEHVFFTQAELALFAETNGVSMGEASVMLRKIKKNKHLNSHDEQEYLLVATKAVYFEACFTKNDKSIKVRGLSLL